MRVVCKYCGAINHRCPSDIIDPNNYSCRKSECISKRRIEQKNTNSPHSYDTLKKLKTLAYFYQMKHGRLE